MVPAVCSVYLFKSLCLLKSAQPAEPSAPMWRLGVGARAGEVISYYFIYCKKRKIEKVLGKHASPASIYKHQRNAPSPASRQ